MESNRVKRSIRVRVDVLALLIVGILALHVALWTLGMCECSLFQPVQASPCAEEPLLGKTARQQAVPTVLTVQTQAGEVGWKTYAIDFYCGLIRPGRVASQSVLKMLPGDVKAIVGWEGAISTYTDLDVDTWLSIGGPEPKEGPNVFGMLKTGESQGISSGLLNISLAVTSNNLYLNVWYHNMRGNFADWHVGYVIYYITADTATAQSEVTATPMRILSWEGQTAAQSRNQLPTNEHPYTDEVPSTIGMADIFRTEHTPANV
jgi:hypothetical protein